MQKNPWRQLTRVGVPHSDVGQYLRLVAGTIGSVVTQQPEPDGKTIPSGSTATVHRTGWCYVLHNGVWIVRTALSFGEVQLATVVDMPTRQSADKLMAMSACEFALHVVTLSHATRHAAEFATIGSSTYGRYSLVARAIVHRWWLFGVLVKAISPELDIGDAWSMTKLSVYNTRKLCAQLTGDEAPTVHRLAKAIQATDTVNAMMRSA